MRALALSVLFAALACGPSFQALYEGDQRFEHCYALDDNPNAPMQDKGTCWRDWMQNYTYGQTRDRVEYAAVRQRALARVPALPTDEAMMEAAPGQGGSKGITAPTPTSAFAPPPKTMSEGDAGVWTAPAPLPSPTMGFAAAPPQAPSKDPSPPPSADCQDDCARTWQSCQGKSDAKGPSCNNTYKGCMRKCFK